MVVCGMPPPSLVFISCSQSPLPAKLCSNYVQTLLQVFPISEAGGIAGRAVISCPSNAHLQGWYLSAPLHHLCLLNFVPNVSIGFICLQHNQQAIAHIRSWRHSWEGCSRLSIEYTPPNLVSFSSSPLPMSAKFCSKCVHRSVQDLEIYRIISRPVPYQKLEAYLIRK